MPTPPSALNQITCHIRHVRYSLPVLPCGRCQQLASRVWDASRTAVDLDLDQPVLLLVTVSVHHCPACRHYFRSQPPFLRAGTTYTTRVVSIAVQSVYRDRGRGCSPGGPAPRPPCPSCPRPGAACAR